jgi:hypothetical protein
MGGGGSFTLDYSKDPKMRLGASWKPRLIITQHSRDRVLLNRIQSTFDCGSIFSKGSTEI